MSEGGAKYIETKGVVLVRERERFTFDSPAVSADEFLKGSPLDYASRCRLLHTPLAPFVVSFAIGGPTASLEDG